MLQWRKQKYNEDDCIDSVIIDTITRLTRQNNDWKDYWVDTFMERERVIKEISDQINQYALPFFERFSNLEQLIEDVERDGFLPHRKKFEKYHAEEKSGFVECFREYCNRSK